MNMDYWKVFVLNIFNLEIEFVDTAVTQADLNYGGENIIFLNGGDDPWQWASIKDPVNEKQVVRLIDCDDCGHCVDLHTPSDQDPQALKDARTLIKSTLGQWLGN